MNVKRDDPLAEAVTVTVNIAQEHAWLSSSQLSHQVTIVAGRDSARLNLSADWFSLDVATSGDLTASVAPAAAHDVTNSAATVEMISVPHKPVTVELDKTAYTFAENADPENVEVYMVVSVDPAFPRPPADSGLVSISTSAGTASGSDDFEPIPLFTTARFAKRDFVNEDGRFVARIPVEPSPGTRLIIVDDEVYEGNETFHVNLASRSSSPGYLRYRRADGTFCEGTCADIAYPVTITDEEDMPELSLSVSRSTIDEEDDSDTTGVTENVSTVTASVTNGKSFADDRTITFTFGGTATAGTHYTVSPADADGNTAGHEVTLVAGRSAVSITLTAAGNSTVNAARTITVAGARAGAGFGTTQTVTVNDNDGSNNLPVFAGATATRSIDETVGDAAAPTATDIGAALPAATDADGDTLTYTLEGTDAASFGFDASARQIKTRPGTVYDHEARSSYSVTVKAHDGNGGTATTIVAIGITDATEAPAAPAAPAVSQVSGDPTELNVSWSAPGNAGRPAIESYDIQYRETSETIWTSGPQNQTDSSASIGNLTGDREYHVQVRATNADGDGPWSSSGTLRTDSNTAPVYSSVIVDYSFPETVGDAPGTGTIAMGTHPATDADGDTLTYTLEGPDWHKFTIDAANARLETKAAEIFDYEVQPHFSVTVKADDGNGGTATKVFNIDIVDASEVPLAPAAPTVSGGPLRLVVSWSAPDPAGRPAATSFDLRYKKTSETSWTNGPKDQTGTNASIDGLVLDTEYQVQVQAINRDGKSVWSPPGTGGTTTELVPTLFTATLESPDYFVVRDVLYRFDLKLTKAVRISSRLMRDLVFDLENGRVVRAKRIHKERRAEDGRQRLYSNHWRMTVRPVDETKLVTVTLPGSRPCSERGALCAAEEDQLTNSPTLTLSTDTLTLDDSNLPSVSISDATANENDAALAFTVSLSREAKQPVAVDFKTVSGGTATENTDYWEQDQRVLLLPRETNKPASVVLIEDDVNDDGETVMTEISNARVITRSGGEFGPVTITTAQATGTINAPVTTTTDVPDLTMRIEDTDADEDDGWLNFRVTLSRALGEYVCYDFETLDTGTATEGTDYHQRPTTSDWIPPGVTEQIAFVRIIDDSVSDGGETVKVKISNAEACTDASKTVNIGRAEATGTIYNSDPMPRAWLARFGRTVADQVIDAVGGRLGAARPAGVEATLAGQSIAGAPEGGGDAAGRHGREPRGPARVGRGIGAGLAGRDRVFHDRQDRRRRFGRPVGPRRDHELRRARKPSLGGWRGCERPVGR